MIRFFYSALVTLVSWLIPLAAFFNLKVQRWHQGRRHQKVPTFSDSPIWIHCASLGEFEQGRPIIEALIKQWPDVQIALTFFSSSGYELRKNYDQVNWVGYIPLDLPDNASRFISLINPRLVIFVKYEYWFNHLIVLDHRKIPFIFISNVWRPHYFPLRWWAGWFLKTIKKGTAFFVQDQLSADILHRQNFSNVVLTGDTRIDRVMELIHKPIQAENLAAWSRGENVFIGGSTWPEDEKILFRFFEKTQGLKMILAPHDPSPKRLREVFSLFENQDPRFYSQWQGEPTSVLIIDSVGLLNVLYRFGKAAYIGGGFDKGIHNTLEAAVYGIPVFFGPRHKNFKEAQDLLGLQLAFEISRAEDLIQKWADLDPQEFGRIKQQLQVYFKENQGATTKIIDYLRAFIQHSC